MAEEWSNHLVLYLYDADGSPIGMQYRNTSYAEGTFDTYWFEKNLQGDAVDLIPFVSGVGEVTRIVNTGRKVLDTADDLHDTAKVAKKAPIVVGENMNRVKKYAEEIGAEVYKPWKKRSFGL